MTNTSHLDIALVEQSQAQKEVTVNMALTRIDAILNTGVIDKDLSTPPGSPSTGDVYIVGATATGDWASHEDEIAYFDQIWRFIVPNEGLMLWVSDEDSIYVYDGSSWAIATSGSGESNTASNLGAGTGVFASKSGVDLRFKSLVAGSNISLSSDANSVTISATGGGGGGGGYDTVLEEGSSLTQRSSLNFIGAGITAADNSGSSRTDVSLDGDLNALAGLSSTGVVARTATDTYATRTLTGGGGVTVSNGNGVSGNPTLGISAKRAIWVPVDLISPFASSGCAAVANLSVGAGKPDYRYAAFDATSSEYGAFSIAFPKGWDESTVTAVFYWSHASTSVDFGVVWGIAGYARGDGESLIVAFANERTAIDTGGTADVMYVTPETTALTIDGTPAEGDLVQFRVARYPGNGSDTMAIDARLHGVKIFYNINSLDEA